MDATEESRAKDQVFLEPASEGIADFLANCRDVYYPDKENMTPFQMLEKAAELETTDICQSKWKQLQKSTKHKKKYQKRP